MYRRRMIAFPCPITCRCDFDGLCWHFVPQEQRQTAEGFRTGNLSGGASRWLNFAWAAFVAVCLVFDFLPRHGPPAFRYTGSDPAVAVWNLGWPSTWFIYDPRHGFQIGPGTLFVVLFQLFRFCRRGGVVPGRGR